MFFSFSFFLRERQCKQGRGREREGDTESEAGSRLQAVSTEPNVGLKLQNHKIMTWAKVGSLTNWATQAPAHKHFFKFLNILFILERERESRGGAERGRHRIWNRLQAPSCQHRAQCGARTHRLWDHDLSRSWALNRLSHPGAPENILFRSCSENQQTP